uniref:G/T mismatch-specific thymine DNA glycosylase n=1 Tax=Trichuris muris TaxID=70415 RepID=A0A5S6QUQ1_TRIMR
MSFWSNPYRKIAFVFVTLTRAFALIKADVTTVKDIDPLSPCSVAVSPPLKSDDCLLATCSVDSSASILPDILDVDLDVLIVGINPSLVSAACGHHYAGRGNHFWSALFLSGLVKEPLTAYDDWRLPSFGIGLTNIVGRETRSSAELSLVELRRGCTALRRKINAFRPRIVAFNGKGIYSAFSGKSSVEYGLQSDINENGISYYVMPSSSARCSQFPRLIDKVPFFVQLKRLRGDQRPAATKTVAAMNSQHSASEREVAQAAYLETQNGSNEEDAYCTGFVNRHVKECYREGSNAIEEASKWGETNIALNLSNYNLTTGADSCKVVDDQQQAASTEPPTPTELYGDESGPGSVHSEGVDPLLASHTADKASPDVASSAKAAASAPTASTCSLPQEIAVHVEEAIETVVQRARDGPLEMPAFRAPPERHHAVASVQHQNVLANLAVQQGLNFGLDDLGMQTGKSDQLFACYNDQMPFEAYYHQARAVAAATGGQASVGSYQQPQQLSTHNEAGGVSTSFLNASQAAAACYGSVLPQWTFSAVPTTTPTHDMYSQQQQAAACRALQGQSPYFQPSTSFPSPTGGILNQQMYNAAGLSSAYLNPQTQQLQSSLYGSYMSPTAADFQLQQNSPLNQ